MANLADDDLLLVQRTTSGISTNYCISASDLKEDLGGVNGLIRPPVEVLTPLNGAGITEFTQYEPLSSTITAVGEAGTIPRDTDNILSVADAITGAVEFDGSGDSLTISDNSDFDFGSGDSTIEMFVYYTGSGTTNLITRGTSGYSGFILSTTNFLETLNGSS